MAANHVGAATRQLVRRARWHIHKRRKVRAPGQERGFICAVIGRRRCGGWYEGQFDAIRVMSGVAETKAARIEGLPARFAALFLLCKMAKANQPGMACLPVF